MILFGISFLFLLNALIGMSDRYKIYGSNAKIPKSHYYTNNEKIVHVFFGFF